MSKDTLFDGNIGILNSAYSEILQFARTNGNITYQRFDSFLLSKVNLFALPEDFEFDALNTALDVIIDTLPAIKRIFANPITHIKTSSQILPVESVRVINNETIVHAASHSELWESITKDGLKPRKLLTQENQDNFATYENIIFTRAVDMILSFVGKNIALLNNILYANRDLHFNLLERDNHLMYFMAIGKFHAGYVRDYAKYRTVAENCLNKALFIDRVLRARLTRPVYKHCKKQNSSPELKKTNVFRMDKEYNKIYRLLKRFSQQDLVPEKVDRRVEFSKDGYYFYCLLLSIFSVGHFNFTFPEGKELDLQKLDATATFLKWKLRLETVSVEAVRAISLTFFKDKQYRVLLIPVAGESECVQVTEVLKANVKADEYIPITEYDVGNSTVNLSLYDIDSFRRIQQVLLRGMIMCDGTFEDCPFCGEQLSKRDGVYECELCRTVIERSVCSETDEEYYVTKIRNFKPNFNSDDLGNRRDRMSQYRQLSELMHYRNITRLGQNLEIICPRCGRLSCGR